jgi:hypothetical protein
VALSRATTWEGLALTYFDAGCIRAHHKVSLACLFVLKVSIIFYTCNDFICIVILLLLLFRSKIFTLATDTKQSTRTKATRQ